MSITNRRTYLRNGRSFKTLMLMSPICALDFPSTIKELVGLWVWYWIVTLFFLSRDLLLDLPTKMPFRGYTCWLVDGFCSTLSSVMFELSCSCRASSELSTFSNIYIVTIRYAPLQCIILLYSILFSFTSPKIFMLYQIDQFTDQMHVAVHCSKQQCSELVAWIDCVHRSIENQRKSK